MRFVDRLADYSDESIILELQRVAHQLGKDTLTIADLNQAKLCYATLKNRFGGLREALRRAQLRGPDFHRNVPDDELLRELQKVWDSVLTKEGRRPYKGDLTKYNAKFSQGPYYRRWGSWIMACEAMLDWEETNRATPTALVEAPIQRDPRPKRSISLRLRYEVLKRDNFSCQVCGRSPATNPGQAELHVDHIIAEAKGGRAEPSNLRTLCQDCNIGKGAL
ncbi:MAG TPA: HNH endonuclease [Terriglobia bacterium]|nr:HNH endonuclease [Terriglobia bacterium]